MFEIIVPAIWTCLAVYGTWYLTSAKQYAPLTPKEAQVLWKIHKRESGCNGKRMQKIRHKGVLVGFQCSCGYKYIKRKPIVNRHPNV